MNRLQRLLALSFLFTMLPAKAEQALQVEDAWVREGPPTASVLGGFMTLHNAGQQPVQITGLTSPGFESVEMHRSVNEDGVAKMVRQDRLTVPAGGDLVLAPGGYHLMLYGPKQPVRAGQRVQFLIRTEDGGEVAVQAEVRAGMGRAMDHHHH